MKNNRLNKKMIKIWLTEAEVSSLKATIQMEEFKHTCNYLEIINEASDRGDLIW